jgi:hypothetical protein
VHSHSKNQIAQIARNIQQFRFTEPIVADEDTVGTALSGALLSQEPSRRAQRLKRSAANLLFHGRTAHLGNRKPPAVSFAQLRQFSRSRSRESIDER